MFTLYLFALVVGGGLLLFSAFGGDADADDLGDVAGSDGHAAMEWLSLRTLIYFLFVFGGVGATLTKTWPGGAAPIVLLLAAVSGLGVGALASTVFRYLRRTDSGLRETDDSFIGLSGRMTLPIGPGGAGKVLVSRGDRTFELIARPLESATGDRSTWRSVVVIEMSRGTAVVAPEEHPAARELTSLNP